LLPEEEIEDKYYFSDKAVAGMKRVREKMNKGRNQNIYIKKRGFLHSPYVITTVQTPA
tara:strand:- start:39 stop:212 length:174 start_codon:yes stop_codon:yes gene_type:complete